MSAALEQAQALTRAATIYEEAFDYAAANKVSFTKAVDYSTLYKKDLRTAAREANPELAGIVQVLLTVAWNDGLEWAERVERQHRT